ncbi:hypothetical protein CR513_43722, partial [Mucuna pruriens]
MCVDSWVINKIIVNSKGISVDEEKVKAIKEWPTLKNANEKEKFVREVHAKVRANIKKRNGQYARQENKGRVMTFEPGDYVWVHKRKERINDNAYKLDLPTTYDHISSTFNVVDLSLFDVGKEFNSRRNPFEEEGNDRDPTNKASDNLHDTGGPMIRDEIILSLITPNNLPFISDFVDDNLLKHTPYRSLT